MIIEGPRRWRRESSSNDRAQDGASLRSSLEVVDEVHDSTVFDRFVTRGEPAATATSLPKLDHRVRRVEVDGVHDGVVGTVGRAEKDAVEGRVEAGVRCVGPRPAAQDARALGLGGVPRDVDADLEVDTALWVLRALEIAPPERGVKAASASVPSTYGDGGATVTETSSGRCHGELTVGVRLGLLSRFRGGQPGAALALRSGPLEHTAPPERRWWQEASAVATRFVAKTQGPSARLLLGPEARNRNRIRFTRAVRPLQERSERPRSNDYKEKTMKYPRALALSAASMFLTVACERKTDDSTLTVAEAQEGVEESIASTSAALVVDDTIEITTNFTMGKAAEAAAQELHDWYVSQIPCSTVSLDGATLTVDYGSLSDACVYQGRTFAGTHAITIEKAEATGVVVHHVWTNMTNGVATVSGTADVTWSGSTASRHVVHELTWTAYGRSFTGTGDRFQQLIDPSSGLAGGIKVEGTRTWTSNKGTWELDIDGVEIRGQDPLPQAGTYTLTNPKDKTLSLVFERLDDDTIRVSITGTRWTYKFNVTKAGTVSSA